MLSHGTIVVMQQKPLTLSIVIPVYNEQHHLKACLDAIKLQSDKPFEVLVVDNNSTDQTVDIARSYAFVKLLHAKKQGVVHARNTGFDTAKGEIIGRIDADTIVPTNWVATVTKAFSNQRIAALTGPVAYYDMPLPAVNRRIDHFFRSVMNTRMDEFPFLYGSNMAIRRDVWREVGMGTCKTKSIHEDLDLAVHVQEAGYGILYRPDMLATVSARRWDDTFANFSRYQKMYVATYRAHDRQGLMPYIAMTAFTTGYIALQPIRRSYDPATGRRSLKQLVRGHTPRKNPMH